MGLYVIFSFHSMIFFLFQNVKPRAKGRNIVGQQLPTFVLFCLSPKSQRNNVGSVCTVLPTLQGPRTLITHGLQRLMGCILPTMHCRSQTCWELLHPFAHHCQHARNNSQHCWRNNVGSCCARLHAALGCQHFLRLPNNGALFQWEMDVVHTKPYFPLKQKSRHFNLP